MDTPSTDPDVLGTARAGLTASKDAAMFLAETAADGARSTHAALRRQLEANPWPTLGAFAGVGFVVAGGLSSPAVWGLARVGARIALAGVTRHLTAVLLDPETPASTDAPAASTTTPPGGSTNGTPTPSRSNSVDVT